MEYFSQFGFVSGICFGLVFGAAVGMLVAGLLGMSSDRVNEAIIKASYQLPVGFVLVTYVYLGQVLIKVCDTENNDTGYVDNPNLDLDVRIMLAEEHATNTEERDKKEMLLDSVINEAQEINDGLAA